jgi:hypothetical protein
VEFVLLQQECFELGFVAFSRIWRMLDLAMEAAHDMLPEFRKNVNTGG